jgi:hypothetical protein
MAPDTIFGKVWPPKSGKIACLSYLATEVAAYDTFSILKRAIR